MKRLLFTMLLVAVAFSLNADEGRWQFKVGPRIWGVTVGARYFLTPASVDGVETSLTGSLGAAWETLGYYRRPDGSLFTVSDPSGSTDDAYFSNANVGWELGVQQGLLPRSDTTDDRAIAFAIYRGEWDHPFPEPETLFFDSGLDETSGALRGSILAGLAWSTVVTDRITRSRSGTLAEIALEWGPAFLHNELAGTADYTRTTLTARGYLPLLTLDPVDGRNRFSLYLAGAGVVDWATGPRIPFSIRSTTGGRSVRSAPGGSVRGYESGRFDSTLKALANLELRAALPAIVLPGIVPGIVVYTDAGYYLDSAERSPVPGENSGVIASSGIGLSVDLFDAAVFVFYTNYLWTEGDLRTRSWVPFVLGFGFHF